MSQAIAAGHYTWLRASDELHFITMASKKYSPAIRITTGLLGLGGVAAIAFEAFREGGMQFDVMSFLMLFAKLFAAYIFF